MQHVPAWKKIAIAAKQAGNEEQESALNVTTHLATGSLSKREKRSIIRGEPEAAAQRPAKKRKREKAPREQRLADKDLVLRDQLRYLIDFYRERVGELPQAVWEHGAARAQVLEAKEEEKTEEPAVVTAWKFSKQKQNWLLKHVLDTGEIPTCYDELLAAYVRDLRGRAREVLEQRLREELEREEGEEGEKGEKGENSEKDDENAENAESPENPENPENPEDAGNKDATQTDAAPSAALVRARLLLEHLAS
ncbi:LAFE_0F11210g1_1 [Lachancea fermentati]|uniref:LAFE_0F11210g1_1 n=1 Tax=Lachancea fermentati TaxID=4955 RepID=A0A1G4MFE7_LACFM|nr:LAFE_0F11210g1_1 [Lachancea fermentati]